MRCLCCSRLHKPPLALLATLTVVAGFAAPQRVDTRISDGSVLPTRVPFKVEQGCMVLEAHLGSGLPIRCVLDSGLVPAVMAPGLAEERGIRGSGEAVVQTPLGALPGRVAGTAALRLGAVTVEGVPVTIADMRTFLSPSRAETLPQLWMGVSALAPVGVLLNPDDSVLVLLEAGSGPPRAFRTTMLDVTSQGMQTMVSVNGTSGKPWILSTGTPGTLVPASIVKALGLPVENEREVRNPGGGVLKIGTVTLKEISMGPVKIEGVRAVTVLSGHDVPTGVVGTDVLLRYQLYINVSRRILGFLARKEARTPNTVPPTGESQRVPVGGIRRP